MSVTIYVVGPVAALKTNQWSAMTNSFAEVEKLLCERGEYQTYKAVEVRDAKARRRQR